MVDMTFFARIREWSDGRKVIIIPTKHYKGRQIPIGKMCKIEITQVEE